MFTGLIEEMGVVRAITAQPPGALIEIETINIGEGVKIGDSICVNGCCLTVIKIGGKTLEFEAVQETLDRTTIGKKQTGDQVNLERSLAVGDRMGGHFVTGHVDGLATLSQVEPGDLWSKYWFDVSPQLTRQMASKGSVTVEGASLTLVDVSENRFSIACIPHTLAVTTLGQLTVGDFVNVETDVLAKYVQQQLNNKE